MKQLIYSIFSLSIIIICLACTPEENNNSIVPTENSSGNFDIISIGNSNTNRKDKFNGEFGSYIDYKLGALHASKNFGFLLTNQGGNPIFDVHFTSNNPNFVISPTYISEIPTTNLIILQEKEISGFIPLINLEINHGIRLNGVGYSPLLPMENNESMISIKGKTINKKDTVEVGLNILFSVEAKVMDIELISNGTAIDLTKYNGVSYVPDHVGGLRYYILKTPAQIKNTGNVPIQVTSGTKEPYTLKIGDTGELSNGVLKLDGNGTITDPERIQLRADGVGYMSIGIGD